MDDRVDGSSDPLFVGDAMWTERPQVMHKAPYGRTRRGDRLGPSPQPPIKANCLNLNQKKCKFLYDSKKPIRRIFFSLLEIFLSYYGPKMLLPKPILLVRFIKSALIFHPIAFLWKHGL